MAGVNGGFGLEVANGTVSVKSPYNKRFIDMARKMGGSWNGDVKVWEFDARDTERVKDAVADCYGHYFDADVEIVDVRIVAKDRIEGDRMPVYFGPREVAIARGRDSGAWLGDKVVEISGRIFSGGSARNWDTVVEEGSIFEVRDFPKVHLGKVDREVWDVEVIGEQKTEGDSESVVENPAVPASVRKDRIEKMFAFINDEATRNKDKHVVMDTLFDMAHGIEN